MTERSVTGRDVRLAVDLTEPSTLLTASAVLGAAGHVVVDEGTSGAVVVTDDGALRGCGGRGTILLVRPLAKPCACALDRVVCGALSAALTTREIHLLPTIVDAVGADLACVSDEVVHLAAALPALSERQLEVLVEIAAGGTAEDAARRLHLSVATVKRDLSALLTGVGVKSRVELVLRATELGLLEPNAS